MNKLFVVLFVAGAFCAAGYASPWLGSALSAAPTTAAPTTSLLGSAPLSTSDLRNTLALAVQTPSGVAAALVELLVNLPTTIDENTRRVINFLTALLTGKNTFDTLLGFSLTGFYLATSNDTSTTNSVGGLSLPTATLCKLKAQYAYTSCYICNEDCYVAHNLWGGGCGPSPITGEPTCLCAESAEEATARNLTTDSRGACGVFNPAAALESDAIAVAFRARYIAVQCMAKTDGTYDQTGCNIDCTQNHGFARGDCQVQKPNVALPLAYTSGNENPQVFCICSHNNTPNNTYTIDGGNRTFAEAVAAYILPVYATSTTAAPASS